MKVLLPLSTHWLPLRTALQRAPPASEPAPGSVSPHAPRNSPVASLGMYLRFCSSFPATKISVGIIVAAHTSLCSNHIFVAGNEEQKRKYMPKLATGEFLGAWGLTEPGAGSDAGGARCNAVRKGNQWVLNGNKTFITNGHYADVAVVIAVTDKTVHTHGLSAFVVEKGTKGF